MDNIKTTGPALPDVAELLAPAIPGSVRPGNLVALAERLESEFPDELTCLEAAEALRDAADLRGAAPADALAARALGAGSVSSEYLFVTADRKGAEPSALSVAFDAGETEDSVASFHRAVGLLDETIRKGDLLPRTESLSGRGSQCSYCDVAAVCGPGHARVYDAKREAERAGRPGQPLFVLEEVP